jgi:hypothetical protein
MCGHQWSHRPDALRSSHHESEVIGLENAVGKRCSPPRATSLLALVCLAGKEGYLSLWRLRYRNNIALKSDFQKMEPCRRARLCSL